MMAFQLLLLFVLLSYYTVFSTEVSMVVKTGISVQFHVETKQLPESSLIFFWIKDSSTNIITFLNEHRNIITHSSYKDRVYFNNTTFSLMLKNVQKADSGLYIARLTGDNNTDAVKYRLTVIDEVQAPVLTVNSNWSSPDLCSFTCRGHDIYIRSVYNSSGCSKESVTSDVNHTLKLNCNDTSIICNSSNPVSWKTDVKEINKFCTATPKKRSDNPATYTTWLIILIVLILLGLLVLVAIRIYKKKKDGSFEITNDDCTVYNAVGENIKEQEKFEALNRVHTVYDTVREHGVPVATETIPTSPQNGIANQNIFPTEKSNSDGTVTIYRTVDQYPQSEAGQTIYAVVKKPNKYESAHSQPE